MWSAILNYELKSEMQTQNIYSKKKNTIHFKKKKEKLAHIHHDLLV